MIRYCLFWILIVGMVPSPELDPSGETGGGAGIKVAPVSLLNRYGEITGLGLHPDGNSLIISCIRKGLPWHTDSKAVEPDLWQVKVPVRDSDPWQVLPYGICSESADLYPSWSVSGKRMYYVSWGLLWETTGGPIYRVRHSKKGSWKGVKGLGAGITRFCEEDAYEILDVSLSPNEKTCYVTARTADALEGDFYQSDRNIFGWQRPRRMAISSLERDLSLSLSHDGRRMYLGKDLADGTGGDIYRLSVLVDGAIGPQEKLPYPINTLSNEHHFVEWPDGRGGFFIRDGKVWEARF